MPRVLKMHWGLYLCLFCYLRVWDFLALFKYDFACVLLIFARIIVRLCPLGALIVQLSRMPLPPPSYGCAAVFYIQPFLGAGHGGQRCIYAQQY